MILAVAADGIFGASPPPVFFCSLASSVNSFLACACKFFHFSLTSVVVLRATPTALTASAILHHISFFFWFVTLFVSLLCIIERFSSTFSVKMAISDALKFFFYGLCVRPQGKPLCSSQLAHHSNNLRKEYYGLLTSG